MLPVIIDTPPVGLADGLGFGPDTLTPLEPAPTILRRGSRGLAVRDLQSRLTALGMAPGPIDGIFGPLTEAAVRRFQASRGLTVDGIVGPATFVALQAAPVGDEHNEQPLNVAPLTAGTGSTSLLKIALVGAGVGLLLLFILTRKSS